jgi:hypothetical protein
MAVTRYGQICFKGRKVNLSLVLAGQKRDGAPCPPSFEAIATNVGAPKALTRHRAVARM